MTQGAVTSFEIDKASDGSWIVRIRFTSGNAVELHDFTSKAQANAWVMGNAKRYRDETHLGSTQTDKQPGRLY